MTLATSCPACGTVFKIVEDQLKVSEGWVRCGHCQDVFNALEGLFDLAGRARPPLGAPAASPPTAPATVSRTLPRSGARASSGVSSRSPLASEPETGAPPTSSERPESRGSVWDLEAAQQHDLNRQAAWQTRAPSSAAARGDGGSDHPVVPRMPPSSAPTPSASVDPFAAAEAPPRSAALPSSWSRSHTPVPAIEDGEPAEPVDLSEADTVFLAHDLNASFDDPFDTTEPVRPALREEADGLERWRPAIEPDGSGPLPAKQPAVSSTPPGHAAEPMPPLPTFVRQADRAARWHTPGIRLALGLACAGAAAALMLQVLVHHRDGAAARWPGLRAPLEALCAPLACTIQAPRQLDALAVESTALTRPAGVDGYRLQLLLRNHAEFAVLAPHVELSLTDAGGAVVVRRVIAPTDFRQADTLAGNSEGNWQLELTSSDKRVAGYTVAVFYP